jgi:hypothetical protein
MMHKDLMYKDDGIYRNPDDKKNQVGTLSIEDAPSLLERSADEDEDEDENEDEDEDEDEDEATQSQASPQ